jgi:hypothetical protein
VRPNEGGPGPRSHDLLPEHHLREAVLGVGQRQLDRSVVDFGAAQRFFFLARF